MQKVCTHFAVLNKGKALFTGSVEEALSSKESVEVSAPDLKPLLALVSQYEYCKDAQLNHQKVIVHLKEGKTSYDLNAYLISKGITVSHLATERKNLEEQFLEILSQAK